MVNVKWRIGITPIISLAALAVSFINIDLCHVMFLAIPIVYLSHRTVDDERVHLENRNE